MGEASVLPTCSRALILSLPDDMEIPYMAKVRECDVIRVVPLSGCRHGRTVGRPARRRSNIVWPFADVLSTGVSSAFASVAEEKQPVLKRARKALLGTGTKFVTFSSSTTSFFASPKHVVSSGTSS
jgi:hypothetical protein